MPLRHFIGSLIVALSLLIPGVALAETITFESGAKPPSPFQVRLARNQAKPIPKGVPGVEVKAELAMPKGVGGGADDGPHPAIVLLHTCAGVMKHVSHDWPEFLNGLGFVTLTVDSFGSRGLGACPNGLTHATMIEDAFGALDYLAAQEFVDPKRIGVFGFAKGGIVVNEIAGTEHRISDIGFLAGISFYGSCEPILGVEHQLHMLSTVIYGEHDTEMQSCKKLIPNPKLEVMVLRNTHHGFDVEETSGRKNAQGTLMRYDAKATSKARAVVQAFLAEYF